MQPCPTTQAWNLGMPPGALDSGGKGLGAKHGQRSRRGEKHSVQGRLGFLCDPCGTVDLLCW